MKYCNPLYWANNIEIAHSLTLFIYKLSKKLDMVRETTISILELFLPNLTRWLYTAITSRLIFVLQVLNNQSIPQLSRIAKFLLAKGQLVHDMLYYDYKFFM